MLAAQHPPDEPARMASVRGLSLAPGLDDRLERLTTLAARATECPVALLSIVDEEWEWAKAAHGVDVPRLPRSKSLAAHAILSDGLFEVEDLRRDHRFADHPWAHGRGGLRSFAAVPLRAPDGAAVGALCAIDRAPRRLARAERDALVDLARVAEALLVPSSPSPSTVAQALPVPAALLGLDGRIAAVNDLWVDSARPDGLAGRDDRPGADHIARLRAVAGLGRTSARQVAELLDEVRRGRRPSAGVDVRMGVGAAERAVRVEVCTFGGHVLVMHLDRTDALLRQRAEATAVEAALAAEDLRGNDRYRRLLADRLSKEVNTPLTPVRLQLHLLREERFGRLTPRQAAALKTVVRNVERWDRTTQRLLALVQEGSPRGATAPTDLRELAREVGDQYATLALQAGIKLRVPAWGDPVVVGTDAEGLRQVLMEYVENALRASPAGSQVSVELHEGPAEAGFVVSDAGPPLEPADVERVFEANARPEHGRGMGLARCRILMEPLRGRVWAEAGKEGARFGVAVPSDAAGRLRR